ncbi:hypothetical protein SSYRP_v1c04090 [Spiroplasma syrphidicola EA-1]|uniref:Uncharacterized protein n=1 Tax=Spiroplasma syrphidicola EA-1 TaxID=1276229 RepID=R4U3L3_9MOLU|nr:hypothetical protein [Spiroplasma syrphidicola]AGM26002.1 hypothetical protein SSYRP_v1c04090 [Spiroplasma syrphidicola EA-1]
MIAFEDFWIFIANYWEGIVAILSFITTILLGLISYNVQIKNYKKSLSRLIKRDNNSFRKLIKETKVDNNSILFKSYLQAKMGFVLNDENGNEDSQNYFISFREYQLIKFIFKEIHKHLVNFTYILNLVEEYHIDRNNLEISKKSKLPECLELYKGLLDEKKLPPITEKDYYINSVYDFTGKLITENQIAEETLQEQYNFFLKHDREDMIISVLIKTDKKEAEKTSTGNNKVYFSVNTAEKRRLIKAAFRTLEQNDYLKKEGD